MAAVFPALAACQENAPGPIELPDHLLVRQTLADCLPEATDADGLVALLEAMASGEVRVHLCDATEPSPALARDPERQALHVPRRRAARGAAHARRRDPARAARARARARPPRSRGDRARARGGAPRRRATPRSCTTRCSSWWWRSREPAWEAWFDALVADGRAARVATPRGARWLATERAPAVEALFPGAALAPDVALPAALAARPRPSAEEAAVAAVRGHLSASGPVTVAELAGRTALEPALVEIALARLEAEGFALRGRFSRERRRRGVLRAAAARAHPPRHASSACAARSSP